MERVARGWSRWRATVVVVLCTLFVLIVAKKSSLLVANANERDTMRSLDSAVGDCVVVFRVGLNRFSTLTVDDRQSRHWRRGDCVRPSRSVVVVSCARVRGDGRFFFFFCAGCVLVWWRAVDGVCALLGAVCAAGAMCALLGAVCAVLDAACARRCVYGSRVLLSFFASLQRYTDVVFPCRANCRLLLLARRCRGSSGDERGRRGCVEPNVDWSRLLAVVGLLDTEFQLQRWCCWLQRQWFSDVYV